MSKRTTSFAKFIGGLKNRPASRLRNVPPIQQKFKAAHDGTPYKMQELDVVPKMLKQDRPHPAPRPRSPLAKETERNNFNQRLKDDDTAARKRAFVKMREARRAARQQNLSQSYNRSRGRTYDRPI